MYHQSDTWRVFTGGGAWNTAITASSGTWQHVAAVLEPGVGLKFYKNCGTLAGGSQASTSSINYEQNEGTSWKQGDNPLLKRAAFMRPGCAVAWDFTFPERI